MTRLWGRIAPVLALAAVIAFFGLTTPSFLAPANLLGILVNNFALLALVSCGMTLAVAAGGIDLSVGTAIDLASLAFVSLIAAHESFVVALAAGLGAAGAVGAFNAVLIARLRIAPFLATLGTLFIGQSVQQLSTGGGQPIYLLTFRLPDAFVFAGHGAVLGVPFVLVVVVACLALFSVILGATAFWRRLLAQGAQPGVAWYSGLPVRRDAACVYLLSALVCGVAGILLSCTVRAYVPLSGNGYLLNAIGATFIGTTLSPERRPSIFGTAVGVLLLNVVANGLLLIGWNYYWQQVGTGVLIFLVLAMSFAGSARAGRARA
jgi:ribose transport system permease protein